MALLDPSIPSHPDVDRIAGRYRAFEQDLEHGSPAAWSETLRDWDGLRRELKTWSSLVELRFDQNTTDAAARAAREAHDELQPTLTAYDVEMKRRFVGTDGRASLIESLGPQAFRLWETDLATFDPEIEPDLITESKLCAEYTSLMAGIRVTFRGEELNLSGLARYASDEDRSVRHEAAALRWRALGEHAEHFDRIYDDLVRLRHTMALKLGYDSFTALGYRRMHRIDYGAGDVARYREAVRSHVVPVVAELAKRAAQRLGLAELAVWDEPVLTGNENPRPEGDCRWIMDRTVESFSEMDGRLGDFVRMMDESELTDLVTRPGKAAGGYCTLLPTYGVPFIFTNFNGTRDDIKVLMHELGHAFQVYSSREKPVLDYLLPTLESAEIHSMSLEYLTWPYMNRFFGRAADAYRRDHIADGLRFLPYGVAVDHFQHLVYERPDATPDERHAMWRTVERLYLPWRTYGDLERPARGAFWQQQQHIYRMPFYYIDYTLALCCALQFWAASYDDPGGTLERYVTLCRRGGEAPFRELVTGAGLATPFDPAALERVVARAKAVLDI